MSTIAPDVLERLRAYDTPTVCNLIELFDVRPYDQGYMDQRIVALAPDLPPMVGYASTATFRARGPRRGEGGYGGLERQAERFGELSGPPVVVFQDVDSPSVAATFGEVMCTIYQAFGAVGLVTSGTGRDLDQVRAIGFPTFTAGVNPSHGYNGILDLHTPVHVGGLVVHPDDLLHGDRNGVTSIPREIAAEVADVADPFMATETIVLEAMREDGVTAARLREARAEAGRQLAEPHAQVSRAR